MELTPPLVVWGAGAMGGTVGAHLVRAGHDVLFVDTAADHVAALNDRGLRITGPISAFEVPATAVTPDALAGWPGSPGAGALGAGSAGAGAPGAGAPERSSSGYRVVLLAVKAHHTPEAVAMLAPHLAPHGVVVSVQNGLNEEVIAREVGADRTFGCFVNFGADYLEPGVVHYGGRGTVVVGELDGARTPRADAIHGLFQAFDDQAILSGNVGGYLWSKLAYAAMLFATALTDDAIADALARRDHRAVFTGLAREAVAVARARGVRLEAFDGFDPTAFAADAGDEAAAASLEGLVAHNRRSAKTHSGIWRDLAVRKRRTEVDAQLGPVVEHGREAGVPTPFIDRLIRLVHEVEDGRPRSAANLDALRAPNEGVR